MAGHLDSRFAWQTIVAGAIGDILGGISERKRLSLSDDTQLTLATCEALITSSTVDPEAIAVAMLRWFREGRISGIGSSTLKAMHDLEVGQHWALSGARGEHAAGNGAAMRIAPLAFFIDPLDEKQRSLVRDVCRITHHSEEAYVGALAVLLAMHVESDDLLRSISNHLPDSVVRDRIIAIDEVSSDSISALAARFGASGYVAETIPLALIASTRMIASDFKSVLAELDSTGGDADTIGSIAAQMAAVRVEAERIPHEILGEVEGGDEVLRIARDFEARVQSKFG